MINKEKTLVSIAITENRASKKLESARLIEGKGIENDQIRSEIRQLSIVSDKFIVNKSTNEVGFCHIKFKENLIIMHLDVKELDILDKFMIGDAVIEITQVYKKCHDSCPKWDENATCQANKEVAFAKVIKSGYIKIEDAVNML